MQLSKRDGVFLAVALLLHGSLLFIPFRQLPSEQDHTRLLSVSLLATKATMPLNAPLPVPEQPRKQSKPETSTTNQAVSEPTDSLPPEREQSNPDIPVTTAHLVDSASRLKWAFPKASEPRQLGVHQPQETPENWRPSISLEDNWFDGMTVPEKTEVVDQWLEGDGSYNVVINTPFGKTLCGRKQAWDPMNPMLEHLTMFRECGGGGKRTFKMPDRFMKHLVD